MSSRMTRLIKPFFFMTAWLWVVVAAGCGADTSGRTSRADQSGRDEYGRTYYIDGAGNWGFGVSDIIRGLRAAGYRGRIINYRWSPTFNPALDQTVGRPVARQRGLDLGREITAFLRDAPDRQVNIIALSAGTGVAIWACEALTPPAKVHNVILLGSSLSSTYDVTAALRNMSGKIYVYHSRADMILDGPVRTLGTIDGQIGVDAAGLVGLRPPKGMEDRVVNVPWNPRYERYGWTGSHTDGTSAPFVRHVLSRHILSETTTAGDRLAYRAASP